MCRARCGFPLADGTRAKALTGIDDHPRMCALIELNSEFMDADGVPTEKTAPAAPLEETEAISAWSFEDDALDVAPFRPSRSRSALLWCVAIALVLGTAAVAWFGMTLYGERGMPAAAAEPPSPSTGPPLPPAPDQQFLEVLRQIGITPESDSAALI